MPRHYTQQLSFELPDGLTDHTHHVFSLRADGPSEVTIVVSRQPVADDETFASYEARLLPELERGLPGFELAKKSHVHLDAKLALLLEYRWQQRGQDLHVLQVHVFEAADAGQRRVIQISATALGHFSQRWERAFYDLLASARLGPPPGGAQSEAHA